MNGGITGVENFGKTTALADVFENGPDESHECDGCGQIKPDVDVWARNEETGEEIWLCVACVEW